MKWSTHIPPTTLAAGAEKLEEKGRTQPVPVYDKDACFRDHMAFDGSRDFALKILHTQHECMSTAALAELGSGVHDFAWMKASGYY